MSSPLPPAQCCALLSALSAELADMRDTVGSLAVLVADYVRLTEGEARGRALVEAQAIDELGQRLEALSAVTDSVARGGDLVPVLDAVTLADLARRLRAAVLPTHHAAPVVADVAGDLMLF